MLGVLSAIEIAPVEKSFSIVFELNVQPAIVDKAVNTAASFIKPLTLAFKFTHV